MNREIKLRAWNQDYQEFQYFVFSNGGHWSHNIEAYSTNAIKGWQQYTGLKDQDGKEIYEHDHDGNRVVKFIEDYGGYVLENMETFKTERLTCDTAMFFTIKGNIHENAK